MTTSSSPTVRRASGAPLLGRRSFRRWAAPAALVGALLAGCSGDEDPVAEPPADVAAEPTEAAAGGEVEEAEWSYEGATGPENWAQLDAAFATCGTGTQQSPVDLIPPDGEAGTEPEELAEVLYNYEPGSFALTNTGHTVVAEAESAGGITIDGESYDLLQFHAHAPSEHALDGERTPLEVHLVHQNEQDELAVVGVLVQEGSTGTVLTRAWSDLPTEPGETATLDDFDPAALLPEDRTTYRYEGSLTTPPCTEGVRWLVMQQTVAAPPDLVSAFEESVGDTARPLQPLNDREPVLG